MIDRDVDRSAEHLPVACSLTADEQARRGGEIATLFAERQEVRELPDGYALRFAGDDAHAARLLALITEERACCPFFTFALIFEPAQGPIWLHLRGPDGTKEVVAAMLAGAGPLPATPV
jgi:hypothetical protein